MTKFGWGGMFLALICLSSCNKEEQEQAMIDTAVKLKAELYRKEARAACRMEMLARADVLADSILLTRINVRSPIEKPARPGRPETPEVNFQDTIELIRPDRRGLKAAPTQDSLNQGSNLRKTE
jgi:hypothetical protein